LGTDPQTIASGTTAWLFAPVELFDPSNMHQSIDNSTMVAPRVGTYLVSATVSWEPNDSGSRTVQLKSMAGVLVSRVTGPPATGGEPTVQTVTGAVHLGDQPGFLGGWVTLTGSQTSGGNLGATVTAFEMAYLGP
jgi:hypothetical protein